MSNVTINGDTSGGVTLQAPAIAGTPVLTLPTTTGTLALTTDIPVSAANTQTFNANGTWTKPSGNFTTVQVQMWGAGGGGGRGGDTSSAAVGGGGGGFGILDFPYSIMPNTATVTIGVGGAGGSVGTANGTAGGNTTFVFSNATLFVSGGEGGTALATPASISSAKGSNSLNFNSSPSEGGGDSARLTDATTLVAAETRTFAGAGGGACTATANNAGGTSIFGGSGGTGANDAVNGGNGSTPGGGGGGTETGIGGSGGNGRVIVTTF